MTALVASSPLGHVKGEGVLSDEALNALEASLASFGSSLSPDGRTALRALLQTLEAGLRGTLPPSYYLSAIDPGTGKSLAVATFLRAWKAHGFLPDSSVLVGVSRLAEIDSYLRHAGLDREEVAVLTGDERLNGFGVSRADHGATRILFTTQQMIQSRTRGRLLAETPDFHYQGVPRPLRIWDESLTLGEAVTLRVDDLGLLASPLRQKAPEFVEALRAFQRLLWDGRAGEVIQVPPELSAAVKTSERLIDDAAEAIQDLRKLAGQKVRLVDAGRGDIQLAGAAQALPADFAPAVILDASGRVRGTYKLWEEHLGSLTRLPAAANDYRNLKLSLWQRGSGKQSLAIPAVRAEVVRAMADVINEDDEDWLIIHYKDQPAIFRELKSLVEHRATSRLHSLTWGDHHGTNRFERIQSVMIVGQLTYGAPGYHSVASAAIGGGTPEISREGLLDIEAGEFSHNLLQALCRVGVRRGTQGVASCCRAYVVASRTVATPHCLRTIFPASDVREWRPIVARDEKDHSSRLIAYLAVRFANNANDIVTKKEVRDHLGVSSAAFAKLMRHNSVVDYLGEQHIIADLRTFESHKPSFVPWKIPEAIW